ncbi:alpha/beta hydrolase [Lusitaniella coriacea LEGE 07157]|uniref:Alpha/beta hydrolase n=1 Tax=Lusitaniella coriacea LEGE 07157 TaxID=945747 RepID=A0A8J7B407_9CYAN|nr:alpha/beta hydrolase [Lusitaniella coriacea]MBE9115487.1 alpha/beta hydrolase [Lusitaniella coriacea LEGE 07157]
MANSMNDRGRHSTKLFHHPATSSWFKGFSQFALSLGLVCALGTLPAKSAERLSFFYPPFGQFSITVDDLEIFVNEGRVTDSFATYAAQATPEQLEQLRTLLGERFEVQPFTVYQFTRSPIGKTLLVRLSHILKTEPNKSDFLALRAAFNQAVLSEEGLTIVNVLRQFPLDTIHLDLQRVFLATDEIMDLLKMKESIVKVLQEQAKTEISQNPVDLKWDLRAPGRLRWQKVHFTFTHPNRENPIPVDVYRPLARHRGGGFPVIIISHGVASNRETFSYLAQHLASYGFVVAALDHPDTDTAKIQNFMAGFDTPPDPTTFINRPLDIRYLLDVLEEKSRFDPAWRGQLDLNRVGVVGQSLGAYTALASGGAQLNFNKLALECQDLENRLSFNISQLLQCEANDLTAQAYPLGDERIKAVLAVNPFANTIFGREGMSRIQVPTMVVAGTEDYITPTVEEQIYPFTWLNAPEKYLALVEGGTHFSFLPDTGALPVPKDLMGPDPKLAHPMLQALSTAFFKTHLTQAQEYRPYLSQSYAKTLNREAFKLTLVRSLSSAQLEGATANSPE